ncbi:MAG: Uma2 family endonuclease, partial [Chloroflexota bacterium]
MHELQTKPWWPDQLPDHTQLPDSDGTFVKNFLEHRQGILLTTSLEPLIQQLHPDGRYKIGQDTGIYWRWYQGAVVVQRGCEAPDWFYVPNVEGNLPRSYVMWQELVSPIIAIEFVSGDGSEERDETPWEGKFWVYEHMIQPQYYAIYAEDRRH